MNGGVLERERMSSIGREREKITHSYPSNIKQ